MSIILFAIIESNNAIKRINKEQKVLKIINEISKGEWIWRNNVLRKARFLSTKVLTDVLVRLSTQKLIELKPAKTYGILVRSKIND
jgi:DNA-binding HxlR family transcriptional regulator